MKGSFLFFQGDAPDYFYIQITGNSVVLIEKNEEEIQK